MALALLSPGGVADDCRKNDFRFVVHNSKAMHSIWTNKSTRRGFSFPRVMAGQPLVSLNEALLNPISGGGTSHERGFVDGLFAAFCFFLERLMKYIYGVDMFTPCPHFVLLGKSFSGFLRPFLCLVLDCQLGYICVFYI